MAGTLSLGKLFGINIELHWTFILLLLVSVLFGVISFIILLFLLVLLHELSHSITAKHYKIEVKKIILIPLGGASIIDLDEVEPRIAFRIAAAGPLASMALAAIFGVLYFYLPGGVLGSTLELIFLLNIILGVSNLLPAFPLDGGRILKSYLEEREDQLEATKKAVNVSKIMLVAYVFVSTLYILYVAGTSLSTIALVVLWNFVIVLFVYGGAQNELEFAYITKYTTKLYVRNAISRNYILVKPDTKLRALYRVLLKKGATVVVFQQGGTVKMLSNIVSKPLAGDKSLLSKKVEDFGFEIPKIDYGARLSKVIQKMRYEEIGTMAAMQGKKVVGLLFADHVESIVSLHMQGVSKE